MIFSILLTTASPIADQIPEPHNCKSLQPLNHELRITPEDIKRAQPGFDHQTNEPIINIEFSEAGNERFKRVQKDRLGLAIALCFNGELLSNPVLREYIYGGFVQISGNFTVEEATDMAAALNGMKNEN